MSAGRWLILSGTMAVVVGAIWWVNDRRGPSCEERGGKSALVGFATINNMVGKVMVPTLVAQYRCEGAAAIAPQ